MPENVIANTRSRRQDLIGREDNAQHHALGNQFRQSVISVPVSPKILVVPGPLSIFHYLRQLLMRDTSLIARSKMKKNPIGLLFYL